ncbi:ABC transporter ATP-binding protein [Caproicibacterium lactatifermentans]|mgnify:FL=1|uniref:ATP-binding cassette domain-containing protein n=1 Tax=Caproicibacterium lactatifermentans TaxID=2666138 RepID=A0A859DP02_9FIRM|nr:ABC transporter ATP-binding protein [Caproicibacterium lactatifermentans]QKN23757.1 ATP-binding cassette domain-containing protein [Caproicibacterium lactatifermentans]
MRLFKKFIQYYKPYKAVFFMDMFCALIVSAVDLAFPQILSFLTKTLFTRQPDIILNSLVKLGIALFFMYFIRMLCRFYVTYQGHVMGAKMESNMRQDLFDQYERFSFSYYDRSNTGEMMSKLISDLFDISELAHHGPENVFISAIKIIGSFILLLMVNVPLTLILSAVVAVMVIFSVHQNKNMQGTFMDNRRKIADVNASLQDSLAGIRVVKSFANEDVEQKKFRKRNQQFLHSKESNYLRMGIFHAGNNFFEGMLFLTVLVAGGFFIAKGSLSPADLAVYALYINIFVHPIEVLIEFTEMLQKGVSGFRRLTEVLDTVPEIQDAPNAKELTDVKGTLDFKNVTFRYNDEESVLEHINIHVDAGRSVALVGPSGGGKTTLCSLLPRFYDVTSGAVCIDGKDVRTLTQKSLRSAIGIVQQDVYLFDGTVKDNVAYGKPEAGMEEIVQAAKEADIHDFIKSLPDGYDTYVGERGTRLSGGQKQRIAIARVFLKNPPILILDEATSALDNESERYIQHSLNKLAHGRTTITIAHRLSTIRSADEIIVIDNDGIRERGTHAELLAKNGLYAKYYNMQFEDR